VFVLSLLLIVVPRPTFATTIPTVWSAQAGLGGDLIDQWDLATGNKLKEFTVGGNGRGIVVVGNTIYYTIATSNIVNKIDATTGAPLGTAFTVAGASGLSAIAYDGTNFWVGDYSGTNHAYEFSSTGTLLKTISLANCGGQCDGLEFFNGKLISNRFDGGFEGAQHYDIYDTNGVLLVSNFIDTTGHGNGTGIAFDGTNFIVSNIFDPTNQLTMWDGTTGAFIKNIALQGGAKTPFCTDRPSQTCIEDLSVDYAQRPDTGVPEPMSITLLGMGLASLTIVRKFRKN
jgi:hypothetical protein